MIDDRSMLLSLYAFHVPSYPLVQSDQVIRIYVSVLFPPVTFTQPSAVTENIPSTTVTSDHGPARLVANSSLV